MVGNVIGSSSSLFEFDDECTEDSSVLRSDEFESRSKPNKKSLRCSDELFACDKIGSWVLRKFCTVRESLKASLESFTASIPATGFALGLLSNDVRASLSSCGWNVNFPGFSSGFAKDLFLGDRRLKKESF